MHQHAKESTTVVSCYLETAMNKTEGRSDRLRCIRTKYSHWPRTRPTTFHLLDDHFLLELKRLNDPPREVLENSDRMELFLRVVRADFE
jgi:surfactin synthase thioesterase subunit